MVDDKIKNTDNISDIGFNAIKLPAEDNRDKKFKAVLSNKQEEVIKELYDASLGNKEKGELGVIETLKDLLYDNSPSIRLKAALGLLAKIIPDKFDVNGSTYDNLTDSELKNLATGTKTLKDILNEHNTN